MRSKAVARAVTHEVPTTVADEFLAGPLEPCRREVAGGPDDPEAVDGGGVLECATATFFPPVDRCTLHDG